MKITEVCACGGSVTVEGVDGPGPLSVAAVSVKDWRDNHAHLTAGGIVCGDRASFSNGTPTMHCALPAYHTGMHSDGKGGHWRVGGAL